MMNRKKVEKSETNIGKTDRKSDRESIDTE